MGLTHLIVVHCVLMPRTLLSPDYMIFTKATAKKIQGSNKKKTQLFQVSTFLLPFQKLM